MPHLIKEQDQFLVDINKMEQELEKLPLALMNLVMKTLSSVLITINQLPTWLV
jgi:hypothetical protein